MATPEETAAEAAKAAAAAAAKAASSTEGLVKVQKQGEKPTFVHPTTVADHIKVGWKPV